MADGVRIHETALVDPGAELGVDVQVGPFAIVAAGVALGDRTRVDAHTVLDGPTVIGADCHLFHHASVGAAPQDRKYAGEPTTLTLGDGNLVREFVTLHRGTSAGGGATTIGGDNLFMAYAHVAHDCHLGSGIVMANAATLAGHVTIEDGANVGGLVAIHQYVRIGSGAFLGGGAMVSLDVPPYCTAAGDRAKLCGLNVVGLRRAGVPEANIKTLRAAYRTLFQSGLKLRDALAQLADDAASCPEVGALVRFIEGSERGICR